MKKCSVGGCSKTYHGREFCKYHYDSKFRKEYFKKHTVAYRKTLKGYLVRRYDIMQRRITGKTKHNKYWIGKELLSKEDFIIWALSSKEYVRLFKTWALNNYSQKLAPTVNRINPDIGYIISNMEWVSNSMNSSMAVSVRVRNKNKEKQAIYNLLGVGGEKK